MPLYNSKCKTCGEVHEYIAKIKDIDNTPVCCGEKTERVLLAAPLGFVDKPAFMSKYKHIY